MKPHRDEVDLVELVLEVRQGLTRVEEQMKAHLEYHREHRNNDFKRLAIFGFSIGTGVSGGGAALLKLLGGL